MTESKTTMTAVMVSAKASPKAGAKKPGKAKKSKGVRAKSAGGRFVGRKPASLDEARQELLRQVCAQSRAITKALVDEALAGKHLCAKFLFEAVGLCAIKGDEIEETSERESLAGLLMKQWQLPAQPATSSETVGEQVTEVSGLALDMAPMEEAPVKS